MKSEGKSQVDALLQSILGRGSERFGMAAAVLRGERIIAQGVAGVRKRGSGERITFEDRFHLGSCTKAMTATLVAMLVEEGKLNWTTTLRELFADTVKPMHPAWEKVTVRQVLAHRSGLCLDPNGLAQVFKLLFLAPYAGARGGVESRRPPRNWEPCRSNAWKSRGRPFRVRQEFFRTPNIGIPMRATFLPGQCWNSSPVARGKT
jgi:CubicO group peptidase (beta-lactamase class C family)